MAKNYLPLKYAGDEKVRERLLLRVARLVHALRRLGFRFESCDRRVPFIRLPQWHRSCLDAVGLIGRG